MNGRIEWIVVLAAAVALGGCKRERRELRVIAPGGEAPPIAQSALHPGEAPPPQRTQGPYRDNAFAMGEGQRLFEWFNCSGCHFQGGGGIGPALMDGKWIYGSEPANIYATIMEGRPNGMPSFRGRISDQQAWQIVAYVRSLSGLAPKTAAPGREDHLNGRLAPQSTEPAQPRDSK